MLLVLVVLVVLMRQTVRLGTLISGHSASLDGHTETVVASER